MQKFNFSLAKVHSYRIKVEDQKKQAYGQAQQEIVEQEAHIQQLLKEKEHRRLKQPLTIAQMKVHQRYLMALDSQIDDAFQGLQAQQLHVEQALAELITAQQERQVMDKLQAKQLAEHQLTVNREEQKQLDEMANRKQIII